MVDLPEPVERAFEEFRKLPTIGKKTAERIVFNLVNRDPEDLSDLATAILDLKNKVHRCKICGNICEGEVCQICADPKRDHSTICIVEDVANLLAFERTASYQGVYQVLNGLISPVDDIGPDQVGTDHLLDRVNRAKEEGPGIQEVILAISATVEGETTALFIAELLKPYGIKVSRIASGIPVGGDLEYYDELTLMRALEDRRSLN